MKRVVTTGRTVEEAVTSALVRLRVTKAQANIRVLREPVKAFLGLFGGKDAEVEVSVQFTPEELGTAFLTDLFRHMGIGASVESYAAKSSEDVALNVICTEDDLPTVIGRHGATLDAIQYLVNVAGNRDREKHVKFEVDAGNYRNRRREGLYRMADRAAARALRTSRSVLLEAMSAADRKLIHTYLQERTDVSTVSDGVEPHRKVMVVPKADAAVRSAKH